MFRNKIVVRLLLLRAIIVTPGVGGGEGGGESKGHFCSLFVLASADRAEHR